VKTFQLFDVVFELDLSSIVLRKVEAVGQRGELTYFFFYETFLIL
jgi:hypothetical protein